ncbi:glycoside hydrolase family 43 protein [Lentilactobacillus diolivorans]|uniref:Xylan 1,4-beta-xylosidase n=2 Tax=Lentilactobacillus diolivorans TaxID=179838 RepID=A0A0R1SJG7_9LACO|nr:glycoside hydrolase family 43 protein [Lentilactobacillus diolivorans]KRL69228.1 xylan 1,4-beta-xylosidase [Lentilactobacillus diolivorans DSM 14421]GEP23923.1 glycoside hydrolase 43 family protein [Lentilactobacillus diolivorans]
MTDYSTIKNPILPGFTPDPAVLGVGDDYYLATSTFNWYPGVQIFHSKDLAHWELQTYVFNDPDFLHLAGTDTPAGVWAPDLTYDKRTGKYWIVMCQMHNMNGNLFDQDNYAVYADSINGPWSKPIYLNSIGFDCSLFHDDDGKHWAVTLEWDTRKGYQHPGAIVLEQFDPDQGKLVGPTKRISRGGTDRGCLEAPHIYKHDGYYYLMTAEGGTGYGHGVVVQRSKTIDGPYESDPQNPIITSTPYRYFRRGDPDSLRLDLYNPKAPLQKCGHGSLVHTATDEWYVVHLSARPLPGTTNCTLGRETSIQKVEWTEEGWLRMKAGGTLAQPTTEGMKGIQVSDKSQAAGVNADFSTGKIDLHLMSPYGPRTEEWCSLKERSGWLRIHGRQSFFSQFQVSLLASRIDSFKSIVSTKVEFNPIHYSQSAGLTLYYDNSNWLFARLYHSETLNSTALAIMKGEKGNKDEYILDRVALPGGKAELKAEIDYGQVQFFYRTNENTEWRKLGDLIDISFMSDEQTGGFTGLMGGIGTWDAYRRQSFADFKYFKITPKNE